MLELVSIMNTTMAKAGLGGDNRLAITGGAKIIFGFDCSFSSVDIGIWILDVSTVYMDDDV